MMRVAGSVASTGGGGACVAAAGWALAEAGGACQLCSPAHWSKQARRAWLSPVRAAHWRQPAARLTAGTAAVWAQLTSGRAVPSSAVARPRRDRGCEGCVMVG